MKTRYVLPLLAVLLLAGAAGGYYYWQLQGDELPAGIAAGNGRIEAERIDIATKYPGRLAEVTVDEGDRVGADQVVARLDAEELDAEIRQAEASLRQAEQQAREAQAVIASRRAELTLAERELARVRTLNERGHASEEQLDQRIAARDNARAALNAAEAAAATRRDGIEAARSALERLRARREEYTLHAPAAGRIQYRLAQPGEVLAGGSRVLTMLDLEDVHMAIFLPTRAAGRLEIGGEARIVLDAAPEYVIPARVSFVASEAQFTPKHVETREERDKLMFRVKLQLPPELLQRYSPLVKTGLPGMGYVRTAGEAEWPERLEPRLPEPTQQQ
ncbi:HlyD family secretion protein [Arhodomonas sp. SL1]|uniref:HlyD family secretion protein n=1 Tax=Arhodomonas sp. SL1 TaxID=3425691 RepID=UPI003F881A42